MCGFRSKALSAPEEKCINTCAEKFLKHQGRVRCRGGTKSPTTTLFRPSAACCACTLSAVIAIPRYCSQVGQRFGELWMAEQQAQQQSMSGGG